MKISPLAGALASAAPTTTHSPDRREAALQAFAGQGKIVASDTPVDPQVERMNIRKIKMKTNVSPESYMAPLLEQEAAQANGIIPDVATEAPTVEATQPISPQLAALAKQRRALQVEKSAFEAEKKAFAEQGQSGIDPAKLKAQPLRTLLDNGVTYQQLTEAVLADQSGANPDIMELKAEIAALKEGVNTQLSERDQAAEQQVLAEMRRQTDALVATGDDFEMIREMREQPKVTELIHRTWKQTGEVLDVEEAARLVEEQLVSDYSKLAQLKKIQSTYVREETQPLQPQQKQMRTLTNRDVARPTVDRKARAMAAFYGTLKK